MRALIVEADYDRGALAACSALHTAGWTVGVASSGGAGLASQSRWTSRQHRIPPPHGGLAAFGNAVAAAIEDGGYEVVFSGAGDAEAMALSACRGELGAAVPYPSHERVVRAHDKLELVRAAENVGLPCPATVEATPTELGRWAGPGLVKARLHAPLTDPGAPSRLEASVAADGSEIRARAAKIRGMGGQPLLQELVSGDLIAFIAVADRRSRVVARVQQHAVSTWPPDAGVSVRARTVSVDEHLGERAAALLEELGWFGIAELQFIAPSEGEPLLIDFNGRLYGSLALALASGANLPGLWAAHATRAEATSIPDAAPGVTYQWLEGDLKRALSERRGGLVRDVAGCMRFARRADVHSIWKRDDPKPALRAIRALGARAIGRIVPRGGRRVGD